MKIAVITDTHANLPALQAALDAIKGYGVDAIYHTGDAIGIGPFPAEALDLLLDTPKMHFVMGDHDALYVNGLPDPLPDGMSEEEAEHLRWTHDTLKGDLRETLAAWPYVIETELDEVRAAFVHYALDDTGRAWLPMLPEATADDLDRLFERLDAPFVFYGHAAARSSLSGRAMYVNPGSLGCQDSPTAQFTIVDFRRGNVALDHYRVVYDDAPLYDAFEKRAVPARNPFYQMFFGGRFARS